MAALAAILATVGLVANTTPTEAAAVAAGPTPVRAAFYYPWFPETEHWSTHYAPTLGHYDSADPATLAKHVAMAQYAGLDAFIASWWGQDTPTDHRLPLLLDAARAKGFHVAPYY